MKHFRHSCMAAGATFVLLAALHAQQTINSASLSGRVTDPAGRVVQNATITATQLATHSIHTTATDAEGRFRFPYLAIGSYQVTATQSGFAPATRALSLTIGADFHLPIALSVAGTETSISVNSSAPVLETNRSQIAETISSNEETFTR